MATRKTNGHTRGIAVQSKPLVNLEAAAPSGYGEVGSSGLNVSSGTGFLAQAYLEELNWPNVSPTYEKLYRSDPEVAIARTVFDAFAAKLELAFVMPDLDEKDGEPNDDEKAAVDFGNQVLSEIEGGIGQWLASTLSRAVLMGWCWHEIVPGLRDPEWSAPDKNDDWRSTYNDGMIGIRRIAFRPHTSFNGWQIDDKTGRVLGMYQLDYPYGQILLPSNRSLHTVYGDPYSPEGLATLETIYRMERIKYRLEITHAIGFEHAAGYLNVTSTKSQLSGEDHGLIRRAARAILSTQEGNYAVWPPGLEGEVKDVAFGASVPLLDAIRYWGILKLATMQMQWVALGSLSPYGSYSSMSDASSFFINWFNAVADGIVGQADKQLGRRLFEHPVNKAAFPAMRQRPELKIVQHVNKSVDLQSLGAFWTAMQASMPVGEDDLIAVRRASDLLPTALPDEPIEVDKPEPEPAPAEPPVTEPAADEPTEPTEPDNTDQEKKPKKDMAYGKPRRPFTVPEDEQPVDVEYMAWELGDPDEINATIRAFKKWAAENAPELQNILSADADDTEETTG